MHEITLATACDDARNRHNCHSEKVLLLAEMVRTRGDEIARLRSLALDMHEQSHKLEAQFAQLHHLITTAIESQPPPAPSASYRQHGPNCRCKSCQSDNEYIGKPAPSASRHDETMPSECIGCPMQEIRAAVSNPAPAAEQPAERKGESNA